MLIWLSPLHEDNNRLNFIDFPSPFPRDGERLSGTFIGFAHDDFKQKFDSMSRLDHIFSPKKNGFKKKRNAQSPRLHFYNMDNGDENSYNYPSDHLAILIEI